MNVNFTPHAAQLLESVRAQRHEPIEVILEHALEAFAQEQKMGALESVSAESKRQREGRTSILELQGLGKTIW
jgi:hypothetical protein